MIPPNLSDVDMKMIIALAYRDGDGLIRYLETLFPDDTAPKAVQSLDRIKNIALEILINIYNVVSDNCGRGAGQLKAMKENALYEISKDADVKSLRRTLVDCAGKFMRFASDGAPNRYSQAVKYVLDMIDNRFGDQNLSLQSAADKLHINLAYLGRLFKRETGEYFTDYLNRIRIEKAKELLLNTGLKGVVICRMVGFANYNYFYIVFKKLTGKTPKDFRR